MEAPRKLHAKSVLGRLWRFFHYMRTHEVSSPLLLQIYYVKTFSSAYFLSKEEIKRRSMCSAINVLINVHPSKTSTLLQVTFGVFAVLTSL